MNAPVRIELQRCAKTWPDGSTAVEATDLIIEGGQTLALLGPSGCGKTTLLRMLCGLTPADPGSRILFGDQDVTDLPPEVRGVGVVFQNYALFPNMTVEDNIAYGLKVQGMPAAQRRTRTDEMLSLVHLTPLARRRIHQLSGGQRQRVALARALAISPKVLLLDEPLTALDAKLRETLRVELAQMLRTLGITTVIVTHDQDEAMILGQRIAVMSAGRIEQLGDAQTLYEQPATPFVAQFFGTLCSVRGAVDAQGHLTTGLGDVRFRPHDIALVAPGTGLTGTIEAGFFLGGQVRFEITLTDGQRLSVLTSAHDVHRPGQQVGLQLLRQITTAH